MNKRNLSTHPPRFGTGISGFDLLTGGGLPAGRITLLRGSAGSGKTIFALQTLLAGAREGEAGILVSFGALPHQIVAQGQSLGWELERFEGRQLVFLDAGLWKAAAQDEAFDLSNLLAGVRAVAAETGARRIVFDSFEVALHLLGQPRLALREVLRLRDWLVENQCSVLLTVGLDESDPLWLQCRPFLQALADCVVALECAAASKPEAERFLRVCKYRTAGCGPQLLPYRIGPGGIQVPATDATLASHLPKAAEVLQPEIARARQQLSTRVREPDRFLEVKQAELTFLQERKAARRNAEPAHPKASDRSLPSS